MPHLQLDICPNLLSNEQITGLLKSLVSTFEQCPTIEPKGIKAYCRVCTAYEMGSGAPESYVHLAVCLMTGRTGAELHEISSTLYSELRQFLTKNCSERSISATLEVRQMDATTYQRA